MFRHFESARKQLFLSSLAQATCCMEERTACGISGMENNASAGVAKADVGTGVKRDAGSEMSRGAASLFETGQNAFPSLLATKKQHQQRTQDGAGISKDPIKLSTRFRYSQTDFTFGGHNGYISGWRKHWLALDGRHYRLAEQ